MRSFYHIIIIGIGFLISGVVFWIYKRFKTSLEYELSDQFIKRNLIFGLALWLIYFIIKSVTINTNIEDSKQTIKFNIDENSTNYNFVKESGDTLFIIKK